MTATDPATSIQGLLELARARAKAGDLAGAARTWEAAIHLADTHGLAGPEVAARLSIAEKAVKQGDMTEANAQLQIAWARLQEAPAASGEPARQAAEVLGRLGQVQVFRGELGPGVRAMRAAAQRWEALGATDRSTELELAAQAVEARVDRVVGDARAGSAQARALRMRARMRRELADLTGAAVDLSTAWDIEGLPDALRAQVGAELGAVLIAQGALPRARAILGAARPLCSGDAAGVVDALLLQAADLGSTA